MTTFECTVFLNVEPNGLGFFGYNIAHPLAPVPDLPLCVHGDTPQSAADVAFGIGNRIAPDAAGRNWPSDVRSISVGDVLMLRPIPSRSDTLICWLAVESLGFRDLGTDGLPNPLVPLAGSLATSREAELCAWWARCENVATLVRQHPVLGFVPICVRCDLKVQSIINTREATS